MKKQKRMLSAVLVCAGFLALVPTAAQTMNCFCYFDDDCGEGAYCDWTALCNRHCELQKVWLPEWGQPPVAQADCDSYTGPCRDKEPDPPVGDDGDHENCEPPLATPPTGKPIFFKIRDGMCAARPKQAQREPRQDAREVQQATQTLAELAQTGGGEVILDVSPYIRTMMHNVGLLALGPESFSLPILGGSPFMADTPDTCDHEALKALGEALRKETLRGSGVSHGTIAHGVLKKLPPPCQRKVQSHSHSCQYPHPAAHHHPFPYRDGLHCIAEQLAAMARSLRSSC